MLDIEIMKWGCGLTKGFEIVKYEGEDCWSLEGIRLNWLNSLVGMMVGYPFFLQKVIEGINREYDKYLIEVIQNCDSIILWGKEDKIFNIDSCKVDQAKEKAIEYIYNKLDTKQEEV